jgi:hypothetical protein
VVTFVPTVTGPVSAILTVIDKLRTQTVALTGTGVAPAGISATPTAVNFGGLAVGTTSPAQTVTVTNNGGVGLTALVGAVSSGFRIASNNCSTSLSVGAVCQIGLTFSPATAGAFTGTLTVSAANLEKPMIVTLTGSGEDFSIGVSGTGSVVVTSGQSAQFTLQLAGISGTSGTVAMVCTGAPQNAACSLNPISIAVSGSATSSAALSITTGTNTTAMVRPALGWKWTAVFAIAVPLGWVGVRRRRLAGWSMILAAIALVVASGCGVTASSGSGGGGGGGGGGGAQYPTPPGTYVITVTATMSNITHSTAVTLTVE